MTLNRDRGKIDGERKRERAGGRGVRIGKIDVDLASW